LSARVEVELDGLDLLGSVVILDFVRNFDIRFEPIGEALCRDIPEDERACFAPVQNRGT
jgi:hypothetical protein